MRKIELKTGDITLPTARRRVFVVSNESPTSDVHLTFDDITAVVETAEWTTLIKQVKTRSLTKWKFTRMEGPMGEPDFQRLLSEVSNTPAYQLFLAGFDIATVIGLVSDLEDLVVLSRCMSLGKRIPSTLGSKGLFFVPESLVAEAAEPLSQLLDNNKLCQVTATVGEYPAINKYYIPYATPIDFPAGANPQAKDLWGKVRDYYYSFR